ncbi:MAG: rRNA maturation RNase YbeY [Dehalococcoidia bacterium]
MPTRAPRRQIDVTVFPMFRPQVKAAWIRRVAGAALAVADRAGKGSASIVIADDDTLRDLNLRYRGGDYVTDVLSFGANGEVLDPDAPQVDTGPAFPDLPDEAPILGEVVLSYPLAVRQASEHNVAVEREVALLVVHGILHLLGHDHAELDEETAMKALESKALERVFSRAEGVARD